MIVASALLTIIRNLAGCPSSALHVQRIMCVTANRVYLVQVDSARSQVRFQRPDCHLWSCPDCAAVNSRRWQAIVAEGIKAYQQAGQTDWFFITLTDAEWNDTFHKSLLSWRKNWPKLYARMKRREANIRYVLLPERHKDGRIHMHMISTCALPQRFWKDNARACHLGYMAKSEGLVSIPQAVFYVTKYITKSLAGGSYWPKSLHRVRVSFGWPRAKQAEKTALPEGDWKIYSPERFEQARQVWLSTGLTVIDCRTGELETSTQSPLTSL